MPIIDSNEILQTEDSSLVKDTYSKALLSTNKTELNQHLLRRSQFERSKVAESEINSIKEEVNVLKNDLGEVKILLQKIIDKL